MSGMNNYGQKALLLTRKLKEAGIINSEGNIVLRLLDIEVELGDKSAIGYILQEWLSEWMNSNNFYYRVQDNTQEFPDFFLAKTNDTDLLEVKTFDYTKSPNFDISNFDTYRRSISLHPERLEADYLIIGYELVNSKLIIRDIWLKKVWELSCKSNQYPIRVQVKQGIIHNIRPYNFKSKSKGFQPFENKDEFVKAIRDTIRIYKPEEDSDQWYQKLQNDINRER